MIERRVLRWADTAFIQSNSLILNLDIARSPFTDKTTMSELKTLSILLKSLYTDDLYSSSVLLYKSRYKQVEVYIKLI